MKPIGFKFVIIYSAINIYQLNTAYAQFNISVEDGKSGTKNQSLKSPGNLSIPNSLPYIDEWISLDEIDSINVIVKDTIPAGIISQGDPTNLNNHLDKVTKHVADTVQKAEIFKGDFETLSKGTYRPLVNVDSLKQLNSVQRIKIKEDIKKIDVDKEIDSKATKIKEIKELRDRGSPVSGEDLKPEYNIGDINDLDIGEAKKKIPATAIQELMNNQSRISLAQDAFSKYKKRKDFVKEGNGPNANSLNEEPLSKRALWGINFQIAQFKPINSTLSPYLSFQINKKISAGASFVYSNAIYAPNVRDFKIEKVSMGYRIFTDYKLVKGFFAHAEYERLKENIKRQKGEEGIWMNRAYIGAGRKIFLTSKLKMTMLFLADLSHPQLFHFKKDVFQFRLGLGN